MNFLNKLLFRKYINNTITFIFSEQPIESKAICISPNIKVGKYKFWSGNIVTDKSKYSTGKDWHLYIKVEYDSTSIRDRKMISLQDTIQNIPIENRFANKYCSITIKMEDILKNADMILHDTSQERNGKPLGKNYIHFKGKGKNGNKYEGYLTFSDSAIEDGYKEYIFSIAN